MVENSGFSLGEASSATEESSDSTSSLRNSSPDSPPNSRHFPESLKSPKLITSTPNLRLGRLSPMVTGNASLKLQKQILTTRQGVGTNDWGYDSSGSSLTPSSNSSVESGTRGSPDIWKGRGGNANRHPPTAIRKSIGNVNSLSPRSSGSNNNNMFDKLNDRIMVKILSYLDTKDIIR